MKRVRVRFICDSPYKDQNSRDMGYIDGYCREGDDVPCAVVIIKNRIVIAPLNTIRVMNNIKGLL